MTGRPGPLTGIKAVACSTAQAGTVPYMLMADLGAEVIKIELPGTGDSSRVAGELKGGVSSCFETNNRGVKSLTLNLKSDEGCAILHKLVADADVFGQNFRPGVAEKNGFDYETLKAINPALWSMSRYPDTGRRAPMRTCPARTRSVRRSAGLTEAYAGRASRCGPASSRSPTNPAPCWRSAGCWRRCIAPGPPGWARRSKPLWSPASCG